MILAEYIRRESLKTPPVDFLSGLFDKQLAVVRDKSNRICFVCSRRAGKTYLVTRMMLDICYRTPNAKIAYCTDTRDHAEELVWGPLIELNRVHNLGLYTHDTKLLIRFPNGSQLRLYGLEKSNQKEKLRGLAYHAVFIDEVQSLPDSVIQGTLKEVLGAAMKDFGGQIYVCGTPNAICAGYLYDISTNENTPYSVHHWTMADNCMFPRWVGKENWREIAAKLIPEFAKEDGYDSEKEPGYQREYKGLWVRSDDDFIYKLNEQSYYEHVPYTAEHRVIGIDLGFRDEAAWVVLAYDRYNNKCYAVEHVSHDEMDMTGILNITHQMITAHDPESVVIDWASGGHHLIKEINRRYKVTCKAAEKKQKAAYMRIAKADLKNGKAQLLRADKLTDQIGTLRWDKQFKREEEGQLCDLHDAWLYGWRECKHYMDEEKLDTISEEDRMWAELEYAEQAEEMSRGV